MVGERELRQKEYFWELFWSKLINLVFLIKNFEGFCNYIKEKEIMLGYMNTYRMCKTVFEKKCS